MTTQNYTVIDDLIKKDGSTPISLPKEIEPIPQHEIEIQEMVEHEPEKEVAPFINKRAETIHLPPDLKKLGVQSSTTSQFSSYQNIKTPLADDKIMSGMHAPINSSLRWLATLALYILKRAHLGLKIVHGHVVRFVRR